MRRRNFRIVRPSHGDNLAQSGVEFSNIEEISPFLNPSHPSTARPSVFRPELLLVGIDTLLITAVCVLTVVTHALSNPQAPLQESLFIAVNFALAAGFSLVFQYFDLEAGLYSLGKAILMSITLWVLNGLILLTLGAFTTPTMLASGCLLGGAAVISAYFHYTVSAPYRVKNPNSVYFHLEKGLKRSFDFSMSLLGLACIAPLMLCTALLIRLESQGPAIYQQIRIGRREQKFHMLKFRSMHQNSDQIQREAKTVLFKKQDDPRVTRTGKLIRKLSIDELPQLWNVVRGEMSLVGPRPPIESEYKLMNWYHKRKFEATPGLTGLWQIIGRVKNQRDFNAVAAYDVYYIENWCLMQDLEILFKTIPVVLLQKGAC